MASELLSHYQYFFPTNVPEQKNFFKKKKRKGEKEKNSDVSKKIK